MPNIQGFGFDRETWSSKVKPIIDQAIQDLGYQQDAVTTYVPSLVSTCDGQDTNLPFIRICATDYDQIVLIIRRLRIHNLEVDCEYLLLTGFVEAKNMLADAPTDTIPK